MEMRIVHNNLPRWCHDAGVLAGGPWCLVPAAKDRRWFPYVRQWADTGGDTAEQWLVCPASQPVHQRLCPGAETSDHHEEPPHHRPARPRPGPRPAPPRTRPVLQRHPQPLLASDQPLQRRPLRGWRHEVTPGRVLQFWYRYSDEYTVFRVGVFFLLSPIQSEDNFIQHRSSKDPFKKEKLLVDAVSAYCVFITA